ncbi:hypothetical protein [Thiohalorhabdus sp.]|uniref:hypothetical protein n=1 Tax=Thiohalorhabdus sp. TaxID=3094134 RepID=UPI002FC39771
MGLKSKKKLFEFLDTVDPTLIGGVGYFAKHGLNHVKVSDETYGKRSMIYLSARGWQERIELERQLKRNGFHPQEDYGVPGKLEVQVSYFKGKNWDE